MTQRDIFIEVQQIFRDIFDDQELIIDNNTNSDSVDNWDSLNHINLVVAIERKFEIKFKLGELQNLKNVGEMINLLKEKIK
tara:strand:+ start:159 stop:401 length:243 start_codon:yes stop_codon:yes gene_type:complete